MTDQPGTVQLALPAAARLLAVLAAYESTLADSPPAWMDDDEVAARGDEAQEVRALRALLTTPQTPATPATAPGQAAVSADEVRALAQGLLDIAEIAMPDSYFATDSRCQLARAVLASAAATPDEG